MKKQFLISLLLLISMTMFAQTSNNKYESDWSQVEKFEKESLPQSAMQEAEAILQKAIADKNTTQAIKALIYKNKYKIDIDRKDNKQIFTDLTALLKETNDTGEKALLNSMLAELYWSFYSQNRRNVNQRTNLVDRIPDDMDEWSANIFRNKVIEHINLSVEDVATLKNKVTKDYEDIIEIGKDGHTFYPTLYDFLMYRALKILDLSSKIGNDEFDINITGVTFEQLVSPADQYVNLNINAGENNRFLVLKYYQAYFKDLLSRSMIPTIIMTEISKIKFLSDNSREFSRERMAEAYDALIEKYKNNETSIELIYHQSVTLRTLGIDAENNKKIYELLQKGIETYPNYFRIEPLKNQLAILEEPSIRFESKQLFYPKQDATAEVQYRNTQLIGGQLLFRLYRVEEDGYKLVKDMPISLSSKTTYNYDTTSVSLGSLPVGKYCLAYISKENLEKSDFDPVNDVYGNNRWQFVVSSLMSFSRNSAEYEYEIFVVDLNSGKPIQNASVEIYNYNTANSNKTNKEDLITIIQTNQLGLAVFKDTRDEKIRSQYNTAIYRVKLGADKYLPQYNLSNNSYMWNQLSSVNENTGAISIFTDRSIYRPGQTVYYKAIILDSKSQVVSKQYVTVELYNTNDELVSKEMLRTNELGSVAGEFILPRTGLLGGYYIKVDKSSAYFQVEEYKRPTFEVTFDKIDKTYTFGEEVRVKGYAKNFSGVNLQDADVKYTIMREAFRFWPSSEGNSLFTEGTVKTGADGSFEITFTPEAGDGKNNLFRIIDKQVYNFKITATVTDLNGETQFGTNQVTVGNISMIINIDIPDKIEKSSDYKLNITAKNLQGVDIETSGKYSVYTVDENDSIKSKVLSGDFKSGEQAALRKEISKLKSGKYRLDVSALDSKNNEITKNAYFILYSYIDKKPPIKTNQWLIEKNTTFKNDGSPVEVIFGTSNKDMYILYQLYDNKTVFERQYVKLSDANKLFKVPYKAEYGDEIYMSFTLVKDGQFVHNNVLLTKEVEKADTDLKIKLEVFRDKLRPGDEETWTIKVTDSKDAPVISELLASMYDSSLDKIYPYMAWNLQRPYIYKPFLNPIYYNFYNRYFSRYNYTFSPYLGYSRDQTPFPSLYLDQIKWFGYYGEKAFYSYGNEVAVVGYGGQLREGVVGAVSKVNSKSLSVSSGDMSNALAGRVSGVLEETVVLESDNGMNIESTENSAPQPQIRKNFNETAFFYPQLRTNEKGETLISFKVPESNTTWRFRALAHDKQARVGALEQMVITRKELMVTPNMPRFVRQGDKTSISSKISNLSDNAITGSAKIEFFDPATDKVIDLGITNKNQSFSVEKDGSTSVTWTFDVPTDIELIGCRIVAQNQTFSDGEQHVLAVLSNRMLVTETMPIDITKAGTSTFTMDKLYNNASQTADNYRLTLEYTSNPAWYAVQALPTLSNPTNENAVNWFASYYVNTLGSSIVKQYPKVAAMIEAWKKQGGNKETLVSKLQKDEELKTVLMEETPWVLEAKNETEQMQRLSLLFDLNNAKQLTDAATNKLDELSTLDGGWSWYKGMGASRSITQYILYGYADLQRVGQVLYPEKIKIMQMNALRFIDKQILDDYNNLKKRNKDWQKITGISTAQLEYIFVRSFYRDIPINQETREAERFYTDVVSKNWTKLNLYTKSLLAMVAKRNGDKALADKIVKSIREHAVKNEKLGMYWVNIESNVFMSMSAVSTHTFIMNALEENGATDKEMDMMKRWLINQKQTQMWSSTHATIDAISAILTTGSDWFADNSASTDITVGGKKVELDQQELGTGYIKESWNKNEITNDMGKVTISTSTQLPAYGALYWQYYEDLSKIETQKGELNIDKELFKETVSSIGKNLVQITENNPLKVGDKVIIRLTIRVDRNMDFVQLKDMRASCFEPEQTVSGINWMNSLIYYQMPKDASTNFYFDHLPKGTYVLEYAVYVNRSGEYANGISTIQCLYAPQYTSHTKGISIKVND